VFDVWDGSFLNNTLFDSNMMAKAWNRVRGNRSQEYTALPLSEKEPVSLRKTRRAGWSRWSILGLALCVFGALSALYGLIRYAVPRIYMQ
jgi:hypothetical protein